MVAAFHQPAQKVTLLFDYSDWMTTI